MKIGRYELLEQLGQGGMGAVWLARLSGAAGFEKLCIVKMVLPQLAQDSQFVQRFLHEGRLLVHLSHSNIAQVHDMGEENGSLYIALEYVPGVDLSRLMERVHATGEMLPVPVAVALAQQAADGLAYAHRKVAPDGKPLHIVHRDISPHNLMVTYDGDLKIIDFGIAKSSARSHATQTASVMGKLGYMAPEQARAEQVDARADQYALGVVLWEMLTGENYIASGTIPEMMARMATPPHTPVRQRRMDVSAQLEAIVSRATDPDPARRFEGTEQLSQALLSELARLTTFPSRAQLGEYIRGRCATEFATQQAMVARLSTIRPAPPPTAPPADPARVTPAAAPTQPDKPSSKTSQEEPVSTSSVALPAPRNSNAFAVAKLVVVALVVIGGAIKLYRFIPEWPNKVARIEKEPTPPEPTPPSPAEPALPIAAFPIEAPLAAIADGGTSAAQTGPLMAVANAADIFLDKGDTFVRAGSDDGLKKGAEVKVVGAAVDGNQRPHLGAATVLEVFPKLARLSLDASAARAPAPLFVVLAGAPASPNAPAATAPATGPHSSGKKRFSAELQLQWAPLKAVVVHNTSSFAWHGCTITIPGKQVFHQKGVPAGFKREFPLAQFAVEPSAADLQNEVRIACAEGQLTVPAK